MIRKKICMIGAVGVGKTSLVARYVHGHFSEKYHSTLGVKVDKKVVAVAGESVMLMLWDLAGEDEFQQLRTSYLRGAAAYLLVVDGCRPCTLDHAVALQERLAAAVGPVPFVVALNKCDLADEWQLSEERLAQLSARGWDLRRTSAKIGEGVEAIFVALAGVAPGTRKASAGHPAANAVDTGARGDAGAGAPMTAEALFKILAAFQYAIFESRGQNRLWPLAEAPSWLSSLWGKGVREDGAFHPPGAPFLEDFLVEAESCWCAGDQRVDSGAWVEVDSDGVEHLLHATALTVDGRAILLLRKLGLPVWEDGAIIQRARETRLAYERLQLVEASLHELNLELETRVEARTAELARANQMLEAGRQRLMAMSSRLIEIQEAERRRIARELHDEAGQVLTSLILLLEMGMGKPVEAAQRALSEGRLLAGELLERMRRLSLDLRPPMLDDLGLLTTLDWHFGRLERLAGLVVEFRHEGVAGRLPPPVETAAFRIIQEALTNVIRHSGVRDAAVRLEQAGSALELRVEDRGAGFDVEAVMAVLNSNGLPGMRQRVEMLNGEFEVGSTLGAGTVLKIRLPLNQDGGPSSRPGSSGSG